LRIGIFHNNELIKEFESSKKTSDILPTLFNEILNNYELNALYFAKGPGSFMAIKVTYIFLKTLSITKNIPIFACDGFEFNNNQPIKATGTLYFMKKDDRIIAQKIESKKLDLNFYIPATLNKEIFDTNIEPLYVLPAV
jgi:tRNA A37 threonylcarbamoyladenosine modification protein TsaB